MSDDGTANYTTMVVGLPGPGIARKTKPGTLGVPGLITSVFGLLAGANRVQRVVGQHEQRQLVRAAEQQLQRPFWRVDAA